MSFELPALIDAYKAARAEGFDHLAAAFADLIRLEYARTFSA